MNISIYIATSLDGFMARKNGSLDWLPGSNVTTTPTDDNEDYGYKAFMDSVDALIMGRHTFETVLSLGQWPYNDKCVIVLSSTLTRLPDDVPKTVELKSGSQAELYKELEKSGFRHICLDGGKTIQGFLDVGLVDEMIITTIPVLIGSGIPLFGPLHQDVKLKHVKTLPFENGFLQSRYTVIK